MGFQKFWQCLPVYNNSTIISKFKLQQKSILFLYHLFFVHNLDSNVILQPEPVLEIFCRFTFQHKGLRKYQKVQHTFKNQSKHFKRPRIDFQCQLWLKKCFAQNKAFFFHQILNTWKNARVGILNFFCVSDILV